MTRYYDKLNINPRIVEVFGRFPTSTVAVTATKTWTFDGGKDATIEYTTSATAALQNAFTVAITDVATGAYAKDCATTNNDCKLVTFGETGWYYVIQPHGITGGGCKVVENTTAQYIYILFETGVTTMTQMKTAINATATKVRAYGGTKTSAMTLAADAIGPTAINDNANVWPTTQSATSFVMEAVIAGSVATYAHVAALINESTLANKKITISSSASGDIVNALASTTLDTRAAVDAVALDTSLIQGEGFTVARSGASGTGEYTVTFDRGWLDAQLIRCDAAMQLPTAEATYPTATIKIGLYDSSAQTLKLTTYNKTSAADIDVVYAANRFIHFTAMFLVNR